MMMMMIKQMKEMAMKGVRMLATKRGMLAVILFGAPIVGIAVSPEYAASLAEHLSVLLQMMLDALPAMSEEAGVVAAVEVTG